MLFYYHLFERIHVRSHDLFARNGDESYVGGNVVKTIFCCKITDRTPVPLHGGQAHHYLHILNANSAQRARRSS